MLDCLQVSIDSIWVSWLLFCLIMSNYRREIIKSVNCTKNIFLEIVPVIDFTSWKILKWRIYILTKWAFLTIWRKLVLTKIKQFTVYGIWKKAKCLYKSISRIFLVVPCIQYVLVQMDGQTDTYLILTQTNQSILLINFFFQYVFVHSHSVTEMHLPI